MIVKIYRERDKNKNSRGRRGLNLIRIIFHHHKNFRGACLKRKRNGKNRVRTGQDRTPPLFCPSWEHTLLGGYETETRYSNTRLSIYGMGDALAFVITGDVPPVMCISLYLRSRWRAIVTCVSLLSHISLYLYNLRRAIVTSGRVLDINLTETRQKVNRLLSTLHRARSAPWWCRRVSFFQIRDDSLCVRLQSVSPIWVSYVV
jgi:hypothetical protein